MRMRSACSSVASGFFAAGFFAAGFFFAAAGGFFAAGFAFAFAAGFAFAFATGFALPFAAGFFFAADFPLAAFLDAFFAFAIAGRIDQSRMERWRSALDRSMRPWISLAVAATAACGAAHPPAAPAAPAPAPTPEPAPVVDDPYFSTDVAAVGDWAQQWREPLRVGGTTYALVGEDWPGEGQAIEVVHDGRVAGAYRFDFGGLGGTLEVARRCTRPDRVVLVLRAAGTTKPYWLLPGQEKCPANAPEGDPPDGEDLDADPCYVGADTEVTFVELAIDARHVWLAGESDQSPAACP
jgi:hypothetical protein